MPESKLSQTYGTRILRIFVSSSKRKSQYPLRLKKESLSYLIECEKRRVEKALSEPDIPKKFITMHLKLYKEFQNILTKQKHSVQQMRSLNEMAGKAENFQWSVILEKEFNGTTIPEAGGNKNKINRNSKIKHK